MRSVASSDSHPLRVDFLSDTPGPGRIGMTFAPGKKDAGWDRDLEADLERLARHHGATRLVSLIEDHELDLLRIPALVDRARAHGIEVERFPIEDLSVPVSLADLSRLVERILAAYRAGETIVLHCRGGLGRTGLVAACCVVALGGASAADAIAAVRRARPGTVETPAQQEWVARFARALSPARHTP